MHSVVSVIRTPPKPFENDVGACVRKAIELAGGLHDIILSNYTVLITPNLVVAKPSETGATTDLRICRSIADIVKDMGAFPIIAESSAVGVDTEDVFRATGYIRLREEGYRVIDLKKEETVTISVPKGISLKKVALPRIVVDANAIISVPVMKTHDQTAVTLSLKNMKGLLPDTYKRRFHTTFGLFQGVADLCTVIRPSFCIVDGIVGQEGLGPMFGLPVEMNLIIAGKDPVAVDAVTSVIMGFEPQESGCVAEAAKLGIGTANLNGITVVGEPIPKVQHRFKRAEESVFELIKIPNGCKVILAEKACTGCRSCVLSSLVDLNEQGNLEKAEGLTIVAGMIDRLPIVNKKKLLLIGNCTAKFGKQAKFIRGCTPNNRDIISAIVTG